MTRLGALDTIDGYNLTELSNILHVSPNIVLRWTARGHLKGTRRGDSESVWFYPRKNVRAFVIKFPEEFELNNGSKAWLIDLLTSPRPAFAPRRSAPPF